MKIEPRTIYMCGGKQFASLDDAKSYEADVIGEMLSKTIFKVATLGPRDRIRILECVITNRELFLRMLQPHDIEEDNE